MKTPFLERFREKIILFDGAMGTMLMRAGLASGEIPELWNTDKPEVVQDIHRSYYDAGSDVVQTNTFGASPIKLSDRGLGDQAKTLNREAARLLTAVCPEGRYVAGDIGPTGKMLHPLGEITPEDMEASFFIQAESLIKGGADLISIETMMSLDEAVLAVRAAKRAGDIPVVAGTTFTRTPKGFFTMMGEGVAQCAEALEQAGADVIGTNCTLGSLDMIDLTRELRSVTRKPLIIQPNAGQPVIKEGITVYEQTPDEFARDCGKIIEAGASGVGGCCGTDETFIRVLAGMIQDSRFRIQN